MATAAVEADVPVQRESIAARILRICAKAPVNIVLAVIAVIWLVPTIGLLLTSLMLANDFANEGWWQVIAHPHIATWQNYSSLIHDTSIPSSLWTTMEIAIGGTVLPIAFASLAAYAFAWLDFPGRDWLFIGVIGMLVVPLQMALIPIFSLYNHLSLFDTIWGLILFHTAFGMPFAIFLLRNFFIGIPKDILESARIDGCSEIRIFVRLILPLGRPSPRSRSSSSSGRGTTCWWR
jgi:alpha-glucoside transport system permease protein